MVHKDAGHELELTGREKLWQVVSIPLAMLTMTLVPFGVAFVRAGGRFGSMPAALVAVGNWSEPILDRFFDATNVPGALFIAIAVATGFGMMRRRQISARSRMRVSLAATVGIMLVLLTASFTVPVAFAFPERAAEVILALAVTWLILLGAQLIGFAVTPREAVNDAKKALDAKRMRAAARGVDLSGEPPAKALRFVCEAAAWVAPTALWALIVGAAACLGTHDSGTWAIVVTVGMVSFFGNFAIVASWRMTADLSATPLSSITLSIVGMGYGVFASASLAAALILSGKLPGLGIALLAVTVVHLLSYALPSWRRRLPWVRVVEEAVTRKELRRSCRSYDQAKALAGR